MIRFASLIRRYSVSCTLIRQTGEWKKNGEYVKDTPPTNLPIIRVVILPIEAKMIQFEGGRYTMDDRSVYSLTPLLIGDQVEYKGGKFTIDKADDYSDYADFNKYFAKRVTTHG